jgi:hypothetical protein
MTSSQGPATKQIQAPAGAVSSPTATALLVLAWFALWLAVVAACYLLLMQIAITREIAMTLAEPAAWLLGLSWWPWFGDYWWAVVLAIFILTPVVALVTYWIRHRLRSPLMNWAWGILLIAPALAILAVIAIGLGSTSTGILHALRNN